MDDGFVDALEEGKIVHVPEEYAAREKLIIVKKRGTEMGFSAHIDEAKAISFVNLPINKTKPAYLKNDVLNGLKDNFHWELQRQRKLRNLTRKQLANLSSISEQDITTLEKGDIPQNLIALSKLETFYGISLRK